MFCANCGARIDDGSSFCFVCGVEVGELPAPKHIPLVTEPKTKYSGYYDEDYDRDCFYEHKSKWTAFFLCLIFGWAGFHRFYTGKIVTGIIYLFTGGFFGIGWVLDLLFILLGGFRDRAGQRLI